MTCLWHLNMQQCSSSRQQQARGSRGHQGARAGADGGVQGEGDSLTALFNKGRWHFLAIPLLRYCTPLYASVSV